jgi:hypothetical protein
MDAIHVTSKEVNCSAFKAKHVLTSLSVKGDIDLETCKKQYGPPSLTFVGDVSGSMIPNMETLKNSVLAMCDISGLGSKVRVIIFDDRASTIVPYTVLEHDDTVTRTKEQIKKFLINSGNSTNLELALKEVLDVSKEDSDPSFVDTPQITIFASDGLANIGRSSSADLLEYARSFSSYASQTLYTLGIITGPFCDLNSELLKDMALDTGGSFQLTQNSEGISKILGDALAHHYFVRFTHAKFSCQSVNGVRGELCTTLAKTGGILRADKPLHLVWTFPPHAKEPFKLSLDMKERDGSVFFGHSMTTPQGADPQDLSLIFGCTVLAPALDKKFSKKDLEEKIKQFKDVLREHNINELKDMLHEVERCLRDYDIAQEQSPEEAFNSYASGSGGGAEVSLQAEQLRSVALEATQAQVHQPTNFSPDDFDSQKTVESESNKRQRLHVE